MREISFANAIWESIDWAMKMNCNVILLGEGVDDPSGTWGTTQGLKDAYGSERVIDMPLAENGATGIAVGAALNGLIPIAVHQRIDFIMLAMDQIINHAAKWSYMFNGRFSVPITIRCAVGMGYGMGGQHSQNLHSLFTHIPGLKVVMPAVPYDAKGLMMSSICDPNPVIFIENYLLYRMKGDVPSENYDIPLGRGVVKKSGTDVTIISYSIMLHRALEAANLLLNDGIDAEIIDLRCLCPLDEELIAESVSKTGRLAIVEPAVQTCGFAAEISSRVHEKLFSKLKNPVMRIGFPDAPTPASPALERLYYPDALRIFKEVSSMFKRHSKSDVLQTSSSLSMEP